MRQVLKTAECEVGKNLKKTSVLFSTGGRRQSTNLFDSINSAFVLHCDRSEEAESVYAVITEVNSSGNCAHC